MSVRERTPTDSAPGWPPRMEGKSSPGGERRAVGSLRSAASRNTADTPHRFTLPKSEILRGIRAFGNVFSAQKYVQSRGVRCHYRIAEGIPPDQFRVGFAVRGTRSAVTRNKFKRILRESFRLEKARLAECCLKHNIRLDIILSFRVQAPVTRTQIEMARKGVLDVILELCHRFDDLCATSVKQLS